MDPHYNNAEQDPAAVAYVCAVMVTSDEFAEYIERPENQDEPVNDYFREAASWAVDFINEQEGEDPGHVQDDDIYRYLQAKLLIINS